MQTEAQTITIPVPGHSAPLQISASLRREGVATTVATFEVQHLQRRDLRQIALPATDALPAPSIEQRKPHVWAVRWEPKGRVVELLICCDRNGLTSSVTSWSLVDQVEPATDAPAEAEPAPPTTDAPIASEKPVAPKRQRSKKEPAAQAPEPPANP